MKKIITMMLAFAFLVISASATLIIGDMTIHIPENIDTLVEYNQPDGVQAFTAMWDEYTHFEVRVESMETSHPTLNHYSESELSQFTESLAEHDPYNTKASEFVAENGVRYIKMTYDAPADHRLVYGTFFDNNAIYFELDSDRYISMHKELKMEGLLGSVELGDRWSAMLPEQNTDEDESEKHERSSSSDSIVIINIFLVVAIVAAAIFYLVHKIKNKTDKRALPQEEENTVKVCESCGEQMYYKDTYCLNCGGKAPLENYFSAKAESAEETVSQSSRCWKCGAALQSDDRYCPNCGRSSKPTSSQEWDKDSPQSLKLVIGLFIAFVLMIILPIIFWNIFAGTGYISEEGLDILAVVNAIFLIVPALIIRFVYVKDRVGIITALAITWGINMVFGIIATYKVNIPSDAHVYTMLIFGAISYFVLRKHDNSWQRTKKKFDNFLKNGFNAAYKKDRPCPFCGLQLKAGVKECPRCNGRFRRF